MTVLTRLPYDMVTTAMYIRPQRPDDHEQFEWLLPQCSALFVYADPQGRDWVRWSIPKNVAEEIGWSGGCACCGKLEEHSEVAEHAVLADTLYTEVDWYVERDNA